MEVIKKQTSIEGPALVSAEALLSSSTQDQGMSVDLIGIHPSSSVGLVTSVEVPERRSVAGSVGGEFLTTGVLPTPVLSLSSGEKLDYSGDDDVDWEDVHHALDTSKHSHLAEEEMQMATLKIEPQSEELQPLKAFFLPQSSS